MVSVVNSVFEVKQGAFDVKPDTNAPKPPSFIPSLSAAVKITEAGLTRVRRWG